MDMESMSMEDTPPNGNEMYSQTLAGLICAFIFLLMIRHHVLLRRSPPPSTIQCTTKNNNINNAHRNNNKTMAVWISWLRTTWTMPRALQSMVHRYRLVDRYVVNTCSWSLPFLPPVGGVLICVVLITSILPLLIMNNDLSLNSNRAGFLTIALVPFLLASTGRHSALALLTGMSSVRLNFFHRVLGLAIVLLATVHMACMLDAWAPFPSFMASQLRVPKVRYGLAGYGCLCVVVLGSLYPIRVFKYEIFVCTHVLAFGFIGAISKHTPYAMRYFITGILCYCLNLLASWFVQARLARVRAHALPNDCTRLSLRLSSPIKHHPGQFMYVCIPRLSAFQWHPFTITNTQPTGEGFCDTMVELHATVRGDYTRKLYKLATSGGNGDDWQAFVSGPCGRTLPSTRPETMLTEQRVIVTANAGAGVTFGMRLIRELAGTLLENNNYNNSNNNNGDDGDGILDGCTPSTNTATELQHGRRRRLCGGLPVVTRDIYFIWSVRRAGELAWFKSELHYYKTQFDKANALDAHFPRLHVLLYYTGTDDLGDGEAYMTEIKANGDGNMQAGAVVDESFNGGAELGGYENKDLLVRPFSIHGDGNEVSKTAFQSTVQRQRVDPKECLNLVSNSETMGLFVCGSSSFNRSFKNTVAKLEVSRSSLLDFHCEEFEY